MRSSQRASWLALVFVAACGGTQQTPAPAQAPADPEVGADAGAPVAAPDASTAVPDASAPLCLPVVSGCGCAYVCGSSLRRNDDGTYEIVHDLLDSATVTAEVQRWCFEDAGHGSSAPLDGGAAGCRDVFYDRSPCGGECIPSTQYLTCHVADGGRCVP